MRHWMLNLMCLLVVVILGGVMFVLKYQVIDKEKKLAQIHAQIWSDRREIHMLNADWALLNDPERIRVLLEKRADLKPVRVQQIVVTDALPDKAPDVPPVKPDLGEAE